MPRKQRCEKFSAAARDRGIEIQTRKMVNRVANRSKQSLAMLNRSLNQYSAVTIERVLLDGSNTRRDHFYREPRIDQPVQSARDFGFDQQTVLIRVDVD